MRHTLDTSHNLKAYDENNILLFSRRSKNKLQARLEILNNPLLPRVSKVKYKNEEYSMAEIYNQMHKILSLNKHQKRSDLYEN